MKGRVTKSTGNWYLVKADNLPAPVTCRVKGKMRLKDLKLTNPIAVGDWVEWDFEDKANQNGMITAVLPRENYIARQSPRQKHALHLLACNVDQAIVVTSIIQPTVKVGFIDRVLLMTEPHDIPTLIVFNKMDICDEQSLELLAYLENVYQKIGYKTLRTSTVTGEGLEELKELLADKITFICGHSGVGKSTLVNAIQPQLDLRTNEISDYSGKGQHTTTFAELHDLSFGGGIIDTPGIKELAFINMDKMEVSHNFREIFAASHHCKYGDCLHIEEPNCAVKQAVANNDISETRYNSYLAIIGEIGDLNYWEKHDLLDS
jgi:ribosome biogenesis GTPase